MKPGLLLAGLALAAIAGSPAVLQAASVAAGAAHSGIVNPTNNTVWVWGAGANGRLGLGNTTQQVLPQQVSTLAGITAVAGGGSTRCS